MTWKEAVVVVGLMAGIGAGSFAEGRIFERLSNSEIAGEQNEALAVTGGQLAMCKRGLMIEAAEIQQLQTAAASCKPSAPGASL